MVHTKPRAGIDRELGQRATVSAFQPKPQAQPTEADVRSEAPLAFKSLSSKPELLKHCHTQLCVCFVQGSVCHADDVAVPLL